MQAPVDDHAELVIDSLRHWKPVKVISDCRCNAVELPFPLSVVRPSEELTAEF